MRSEKAQSPSRTRSANHRRVTARARFVSLSCILLALLAVSSCQDSSGIVRATTQSVAPQTLALTPSAFELSEGGSLTFSATLDGAEVDAGSGAWTVEPSSLASIHAGSLDAVRQGQVTVTLGLAGLTAQATGSIYPVPAAVSATGPVPVAGTVGHELPDSVSVLVVTAEGLPVQGATVRFHVSAGGGSVSPSSRPTGADGVARTAWTLGSQAGRHSVVASVAGVVDLPFEVDAIADFASATVNPFGEAELVGEVGDVLDSPLVAVVSDTFGNPLPGVSVRWDFARGAGVDLGTPGMGWNAGFQCVTDEEGRTSVQWLLGTEAGTQEALASVVASSSASTASQAAATDASGSRWVAEAAPGAAAHVSLVPVVLSLSSGGVGSLSAQVVDRWENPLPDATVVWSSSSPAVVTVDATGEVQALGAGVAIVTARSGDATGAAQVAVQSSGSTSLTASSGGDQTGVVGADLALPLRVRVADASGAGLPAQTVIWSVVAGGGAVSASSVVTDASGYASVTWALGTVPGVQVARASVVGIGSVDFSASAQAGAPVSIQVSPAAVTAEVGATRQFTAGAVDAFGNPAATAGLVWSTAPAGVVAVSETGLANAVSGGSAQVRATLGAVEGSAVFTVTAEPHLSWTGGDGQSGAVGQELSSPLRVRVTTTAGVPLAGRAVSWSVIAGGGELSSSTTSTNANGYTETAWTLGTVPGSGRVRAVVGSDAVDFTATAIVGPVTTIQVTPSTATVSAGGTQQHNAVALDAYLNPVSTGSFAWSSSDGTVASVDASGMATGLGDGTAQIRAATNGVTGTATLTVASSTPPPTKPDSVRDLRAVTVTDQSVTLRWTQVKDGTGDVANYAIRYGTPTISWGTASATETLVDGTGIGAPMDRLIPGLVPGTIYQFQIVAYRGVPNVDAVYGPISRVASASTTAAAVASVTASPNSVTLTALAETVQLSAVATNALGDTVAAPALVWQSLNPAVASVNRIGLVTAIAVGSAMVEVTAGCCAAADTVAVQVTQVPARVSVAPSQVILEEGQTGSLVATVFDRNDHVIPGAPVSYSSADPSVASIDATGRVKGEGEGSTELRATSGTAVGTSNATILPPGTPGSWPNEPAGFTKLSERSFSEASEADWWVVGDVRIVADSTAPRGGKVARAVFPVGLTGGSSGGNAGPQPFAEGVREVYIAMWHKISDSWQHHPSGQNKVLYMTDKTYGGNGDPGVLGVFGPGGDPDETNLHYMLFVQGPLMARNLAENRGSVRVVRGDWNLVEVHLVMNSSPSAKDGEGHVWVNGTKTLEYTNLQWSDQSRWWTVVKWGPIWGGTGGVVTREMYQAMDHFYISGRSY